MATKKLVTLILMSIIVTMPFATTVTMPATAIGSPPDIGILLQATGSSWAYYPYNGTLAGGRWSAPNTGTANFTVVPGTAIYRKISIQNMLSYNTSINLSLLGLPASWYSFTPNPTAVIPSGYILVNGTWTSRSSMGYPNIVIAVPGNTSPGIYPYTIIASTYNATYGTYFNSTLNDTLMVGLSASALATKPSAPAMFEPPEGYCYTGAAVVDNGVQDFANMTGKQPALKLTYAWFSMNSTFIAPSTAHSDSGIYQIDAEGCTPVITWQPDLNRSTDLVSAIANGSYDAYIIARAEECKAFGKPVFIRFAHEANGYWYPWNAHPNETIAAYQRIYTLFRLDNVTNAAFVWCPAFDTWSLRPTPNWDAYYPGDSYTDWVGLDVYSAPNAERNVTTMLDRFYNEFARKKPIMLGEVGCSDNLTAAQPKAWDADAFNKAQWINGLFSSLNAKYPRVKAFCYYNVSAYTGNPLDTYAVGGNWAYMGWTDQQWYAYHMMNPRYLSKV